MKKETTIAIVARNAAKTIQRAVLSAINQENSHVLLVDDASTDNTASLAKKAGGDNIKIIRLSEHKTLGFARKTSLDAIKTPYGSLLDGDDELYPGRIKRLISTLKTDGTDLVMDSLDLYDGLTEKFIKTLNIPHFIKFAKNPIRMLERNYLPGLGQLTFRTDFLKKINYNPAVDFSEDIDILVRSVYNGATFSFIDDIGYRMYSYPGSVSRQLDVLKKNYGERLKQFEYSHVIELFLKNGYEKIFAHWGVLIMAIFREEYSTALNFLNNELLPASNSQAILEPNGPEPYPENFRWHFYSGTLQALLNNPVEAKKNLEQALSIQERADAWNNLGVTYRLLNNENKAINSFNKALSFFPEYRDATINLATPKSLTLTTHLLRKFPSRTNYADSIPSAIAALS